MWDALRLPSAVSILNITCVAFIRHETNRFTQQSTGETRSTYQLCMRRWTHSPIPSRTRAALTGTDLQSTRRHVDRCRCWSRMHFVQRPPLPPPPPHIHYIHRVGHCTSMRFRQPIRQRPGDRNLRMWSLTNGSWIAGRGERSSASRSPRSLETTSIYDVRQPRPFHPTSQHALSLIISDE